MKVFVLGTCLLACAVAVFAGEDAFMDFDFDALLKDEAKTKALLDCTLDRAPCGEFQKLKDMMPLLISNDCALCVPAKKEKYERIKKIATEKFPKEMELVVKKYYGKTE